MRRRGTRVCNRYYHCSSDLNCKNQISFTLILIVISVKMLANTNTHTHTRLLCYPSSLASTQTHTYIYRRSRSNVQWSVWNILYVSRFQRQFRKYFSFGNGVFHFSTSPSAAMKTFSFIYNAISSKYEKQHSLYYIRCM